jgi:hypothetical protein
MADELEVTESIVTTISEQCPDVTDEHVAMVLAAWNNVRAGDPLGTVMLDPATGRIAVRVSEDGVHKWSVTSPDGGMWSDMQPNMPGWTKLA